MDDRCELVSLNDLERLYDVKQALESHGVDAEVWGGRSGGWRRAGSRELRLMVRQRDLVYARWVACAAGVDTWPDEPDDDEGSPARARLPLRRAG